MEIKTYPRGFDLCIVEGNNVIANATITREMVPFEKAWQMTFIEVYEPHCRKGIGTMLYQRAKEIAAERGCRLVPDPDMSWEAFWFWKAMDCEALLEVLGHKHSYQNVQEADGDVERLAQQLDLLRNEKRTLH